MTNQNKITRILTIYILKMLYTKCSTNEAISLLFFRRSHKISWKIDFYTYTLNQVIVILFLLWSTLYVAISKCILFLFYFFLLLIFWFATIYSKWMCKSHFFEIPGTPLRKPMLLHLSWSTLFIEILKYLIDLILGFLFWFVVSYPKSMCKSNLFL